MKRNENVCVCVRNAIQKKKEEGWGRNLATFERVGRYRHTKPLYTR